MSYAAIVHCNCYKHKLATEPPHKEYVFLDKEDGMVYIDTEHITDKETRLQWWLEFDEWSVKACSHEDMYYVYEHLANSSGMAHFRHMVIEFADVCRFPTLNECLPIGNDGTLPKASTMPFLQEILELQREPTESATIGVQYSYIIEPLIRLLNASLVTGNPIKWR